MEKPFEVIRDNEDTGILKCNACGCQFDYDVHGEINLEMNALTKCLQAVCQSCGNNKPSCPCGDIAVTLYGQCESCHIATFLTG